MALFFADCAVAVNVWLVICLLGGVGVNRPVVA